MDEVARHWKELYDHMRALCGRHEKRADAAEEQARMTEARYKPIWSVSAAGIRDAKGLEFNQKPAVSLCDTQAATGLTDSSKVDRVLDAARAWFRQKQDTGEYQTGALTPQGMELCAATLALDAKAPRYYAPGDDGWVYDDHTRPALQGVVRVHRRELLPTVLAALNAQERAK